MLMLVKLKGKYISVLIIQPGDMEMSRRLSSEPRVTEINPSCFKLVKEEFVRQVAGIVIVVNRFWLHDVDPAV